MHSLLLLALVGLCSTMAFTSGVFGKFRMMFGSRPASQYPIYGAEELMRPKKHGTSDKPVQEALRWNCDRQKADKICNFNRHYGELSLAIGLVLCNNVF